MEEGQIRGFYLKHRLGLALVAIGFILIVLNAADYIVGWNAVSPSTGGFGIILVMLGIVFGKRFK